MKQFFSKIKAWIVGHKIASIIIGASAVVVLTLAIVLPVTLSSKKGDGGNPSGGGSSGGEVTPPAHTHVYDDFGICDCGHVEEKPGLEAATAGDFTVGKSAAPGTKHLYKLHLYKDHNIAITINHFYDANSFTLKWVEDGTVKYQNIKTDTFEVKKSGVYYLSALTSSGCEGKEIEFKYAYTSAPHTYDENGFCECGNVDTGEKYKALYEDALSLNFDSTPGTVHKYYMSMHKDHKYIAKNVTSFPSTNKVDVYAFDKPNGVWLHQNFDFNGLEVFNNNAFFNASITATHYLRFTSNSTVTNAFFKLSYATGTHKPNDYGMCDCETYLGKAIDVSASGSPQYETVGVLEQNEKKYYKFTTAAGSNFLYISGVKVGTGNFAGLYDESGNLLATNLYNQQFKADEADWLKPNKVYYLVVTEPEVPGSYNALAADSKIAVYSFYKS